MEPAAEEDGVGGAGDGEDDVGVGDGLFGGEAGAGFDFFCEGCCVSGIAGPDADFFEFTDVIKGGEVGVGLDSAAEDGEGEGQRRCEKVDCDGGDGGGAHFGDEAAVEDGEGFAGGGAEELDDGVVGVDAEGSVVGEGGDELGAEDVSVDGRHGGEPARGFGQREDGADGLLDAAGGEIAQGLADDGDETGVGEDGADVLFGEVER